LASSGRRNKADILSLLGKSGSTAGRVSATAGKLSSGLSHIGAAATYLKALPLKPGVAAFAAVAEGGGGWRFVSTAGGDVVANSAADVARLLEREATAGKALDLHLPPSALAGEPAMLDQMFGHASVNIVGRSGMTYPAHRVASADAGSLPLHVLLHAARIFARDQAHEDAQDEDIIAGVPGFLSRMALINLVLGAIAWDMANRLLLQVWPRAVRWGAMLLIVLPLFGYVIFPAWLARLVWRAVAAPFRWLARVLAS
jgi:hypothetical protein